MFYIKQCYVHDWQRALLLPLPVSGVRQIRAAHALQVHCRMFSWYKNLLNLHRISKLLMMLICLANAAPMRAYVSAATYQHERTFHMSILSAAQSLGMIIGPSIQVC